jgi:transposase InsO family protein
MPAEEPMERVQIDLIGPMANSAGYSYIMTIIDGFSRWVEAIPLTNKRAETVAWAILTQWICRHGWMKILHSDNGTEFVNETLKHLCEWLGMRRTTTTPYHPQGNGLCERANQAIKRATTAIVIAQGTKWHDALPLALWCIRSAINSTTGYSPYEILHGARMKMPYDVVTQSTPENEAYYNDYIEKLEVRMHDIFNDVTTHMAEANA